jgi:hypothetical protein
MRVGGQLHAPAALPPRKRPGAHCIGGWVRKISSPPGFDPRTVQPVASRYTDYAIPAHINSVVPKVIYITGKSCEIDTITQQKK